MSTLLLVKVRCFAGFYYAKAGTGLTAKWAVTRVSGPAAAQAAAAKVLGPTVAPGDVQLAKHAPAVFRATLSANHGGRTS